jgi:hypothetical protein
MINKIIANVVPDQAFISDLFGLAIPSLLSLIFWDSKNVNMKSVIRPS